MMLGEDVVAPPNLVTPPEMTPRGGLEEAIRRALTRPPCFVCFSGGRDSSAVLALAVRVALAEDLPLPVPATVRFRSVPSLEESAWQELVVEHLHLSDWIRVEVDDELDFVGPVARGVLERHGILFPASLNLVALVLQRTGAATLLTGIGGDSILGAWRFAGAARTLAWRAVPMPGHVPAVGYALLPAPARAAVLRWRVKPIPWLRPAAWREIAAVWSASEAAEPSRWDDHLRWRARLRRMRAIQWSTTVLGESEHVEIVNPLLAPDFLGALAHAGGRTGFGDRTSLMGILFSDVLPEPVVSRSDKAYPGNGFFQRHSRELATRWAGEGVDLDLVDADALRAAWLAPAPDPRAALLLQSAYLASRSGRGGT
jgi:hypothetical protein